MKKSREGKGIQWAIFACLFIMGWIIAGSGLFTQLHEDGHMVAADDVGLQSKQIARNMVLVAGDARPSEWKHVYMAGYTQVVATTGFLLLVGWIIACLSPVWAWMGILAGAFDAAWFAPIGSSDFARLSMSDLQGWWVACFALLSIYWIAFAVQRVMRG